VKLVCISAWPMPYNTPVLNALAQHLDLHALYMSGDDRINRFVDVWGDEPTFDYSFFWSKTLHSEAIDLQAQFSLGVSRRLAKLRPDAILIRSWKPVVLEPLLWSRWSGRAAVMWAESTSFSGLMRGAASTQIRRLVVRKVDSFVSNGSQATAYLRMLGAPAGRIVTSRLPAGLTSMTSTSVVRRGRRDGVRFLYVGRLIPRKRPMELIRAFETVRRELPDTTLTLVGGGELEPAVREAAARTPGVRYGGVCEGRELAVHYAESDVLVLPALREVWGLVVNEALAHGLFVIATDEVGSAYDLLDERSGMMLPANDLERLAPALIETARTLDVGDVARGRRALAVSDCTPDRFASDICQAAELALRRRGVPRHDTSDLTRS
jgi:glycosyltransferase involved in cell wall biosynthesis